MCSSLEFCADTDGNRDERDGNWGERLLSYLKRTIAEEPAELNAAAQQIEPRKAELVKLR